MSVVGWAGVVVFGAVFVVAGARMAESAKTLKRMGATIVAFELAGSATRSAEILARWGPVGRAAAVKNVRLDALFIVGYAGTLSVLLWSLGGNVGRVLVLAVLAAAACDAVENAALLTILRSGAAVSDALARRAASFARVKFALVAVSVLWLAVSLVLRAIP